MGITPIAYLSEPRRKADTPACESMAPPANTATAATLATTAVLLPVAGRPAALVYAFEAAAPVIAPPLPAAAAAAAAPEPPAAALDAAAPLQLVLTLALERLVLFALPLVALPADVLPLEVDEPEVEPWLLVLLTRILLLQVRLVVFVVVLVDVFVEPGPVFVIVAADATPVSSVAPTAAVDRMRSIAFILVPL
jgi:hypothetical protein